MKSRVNYVSRMKRQSKGHIFLSNSDIEAKYSVESIDSSISDSLTTFKCFHRTRIFNDKISLAAQL